MLSQSGKNMCFDVLCKITQELLKHDNYFNRLSNKLRKYVSTLFNGSKCLLVISM